MIQRVTNPAAVLSPGVLAGIKRGLVVSGFELDPDPAARHLLACCHDPHLGLWLALDRGVVRGVLACSLPNNPLAQYPEIFVNASWGPPPQGLELVGAAVAFVKAAGYNRCVAWNRTGRSDAVFARKYRSIGRDCRPLGTMFEFIEAAG